MSPRGAPAPRHSPAEGDRPRRPGPVVVLRAVASVVAPLTLITAVMLYYGLIHTHHFFAEFGVNYTVFDLGAQDFILRSVDGLFVPVALGLLVILVVAWVYQLLLPDLPAERGQDVARFAIPVFALLGSTLLALALWGFYQSGNRNLNPFEQLPWLSGLALAAGVLLLQAATRIHHWVRDRAEGRNGHDINPVWAVTEWTAVIVLVSTGLFLAVGTHSEGVGKLRAHQVVRELGEAPFTTVYADQRLTLTTAGAYETVCSTTPDAELYRYDGLHLVLQEGGHLLLLPFDYTWGVDRAIVLPQSQVLRLEFTYHWPEELDC